MLLAVLGGLGLANAGTGAFERFAAAGDSWTWSWSHFSTMDDDALKKNTDCVYFLASPLTCKKGNDCEFRHSESARVNPRDCRYWLSGNCLNWDCPFRHPPLEGRPVAAAASAPGGSNKSRVPCYFFSQGFCAKGEKCPFMHGTPSLQTAKSPVLPRSAKAASGNTTEKVSEIPAANGVEPKSVQVATSEAHVPTEVRPANTGGVQPTQKDVRSGSAPPAAQNGGPRGRTDGPVVSSGHVGSRLRLRQVQPGDDRVQNGMEPDEWWEESSPGFDVLVDDGPEQSRYADDPEFQSGGETGLDSGKVAAGNRGRGRAMRLADEMEQYDYDFSNHYDHPINYEGGTSYDHDGYEYNVREKQGGYDPPNAYDRSGHQRLSGYSADEMLARERLGLPMDVDMRSGGGAHDQRTRIVKRRRPDGGQQHAPENHPRRQRTEVSLEEYQLVQRRQDDKQKQHELHLRHQLFVQQHGIRGNNRRGHEKTGLEPNVIARRALHEIGASEVGEPALERIQLKSMPKGRSLNDQPRMGMKEVDIHSRLSKGESESRNYMDLEGTRRGEKDVRKEPSTFAGPKSLAQIRAEKRKGAVEEAEKPSESSNGLKKSGQSSTQVKGPAVRNQPHQVPAVVPPDGGSLEAPSMEEKKIKLDKVVTQELKKLPSFEGPKPLSLILKEKRRVESDIDPKREGANLEHLQRISSSSSRVVVAARVESAAVDSHMPEVDAEVGTDVGFTEVEDGEFLSDDEEALEARKGKSDNGRGSRSPNSLPSADDGALPRDSQWQEKDVRDPSPVQGEEGHMAVEPSNGDVLYEGQEFEEDGMEESAEPEQDEDGYGLDEEDEDDFAKKLGGFFS